MVVLALALIGGCQNSQSSSSSSAGTSSAAIVQAAPYAPLPPTALVIKESHLPINFHIGPAGFVRVRDLTAGVELAADNVISNTVIRVDPEFGIYFGRVQISSKKLDRAHRYQVSLDTTVQPPPSK